MTFNRRFRIVATVLLGLFLGNGVARAQTVVRPGFNLFSVQQDIDIGRQSSVQVEKQFPMVSRPAVTQYVARLGARLARYAPGSKYPYQFKVVNLSDINAFALPGGYVYIHRGLIERAKTEGELAGVMAHEISHVALRHQTNQVSKAYLAETGVGILGGLFGSKSQSTAGSIMGTVGGLGLNALFLKNSRSAEEQADIVGAQIMAKAGYDPMDMARFFDTLVWNYVLEGHVPAEDIQRLLKERPDIVGIGVPGMPIGSPGMEIAGMKPSAYDVLAFDKTGKTRVFASHGR